MGNCLVRLPIAALALPAATVVTVGGVGFSPRLGLGLPAVFLAILGDYYTRAAVNWSRFASGRWLAVAREAGIGMR